MVTRFGAAIAVALVLASVFVLHASAQTPHGLLLSAAEGAAGSRFQIVGEGGWTPGETVGIDVAFADADPAAVPYTGDFYRRGDVAALRDGTWSFPVVVNQALFPFPLWRPGYVLVRAQGASMTETAVFVYTVEGRRPLGAPPLAPLGFGPAAGRHTPLSTLALFAGATGALIVIAGAARLVPQGGVYSSPISRRNRSWFGSRPRKSRTRASPSTLPPRSRILRR